MKYIFSLTCLCYSFIGFNQTNFCGTTFKDQKISLELQSPRTNYDTKVTAITYIPLMVHSVANDNSNGFFAPWNLFETLCTLNGDFEESGIQFFLEKDFNYIKNSAWNDHDEFSFGEEMMIQSNVKNMVNCYLVSNPSGNCGYFTYSGDGVALSKSCLGKKSHTWAHELGHFFSLPHTFFGWEGVDYSNGKNTIEYQSRVFTTIENVDRDLCKNQADRFCDTEPDYISNRWSCGNDGFSNYLLRDTRDSTFRVDGSLFMSYSNDDCMNRFSAEQMDAMHRSIQGPRSNLKRNNVIPKFINSRNILLQFPINGVDVPMQNITLSWDSVTNAKYYVLQISRTENFTIVIKNLLLTNPSAIIDSLIQGKNYWWRVRAFSEFDFCGAESPVGFFKTEAIITAINDDKVVESILIKNPVSSYETIQIITNPGTPIISDIFIHDLTGRTFTHNVTVNPNTISIQFGFMPDGLYFLRVRYSNTFKVFKLVVKNI